MKKLLIVLLLLAATSVQAHGYRGGYWVAPAIIGGVIGYELSQPKTVIVEQPSVVYTQPQIVLGPNDVVVNGIIYTKQLTVVNGITQEVLVRK